MTWLNWSKFDFRLLADCLLETDEVSHEDEVLFDRTDQAIFGPSLVHDLRRSKETGYITDLIGAPKGNRTPVFAVKGRRPRPLDDGRGLQAALGAARTGDL